MKLHHDLDAAVLFDRQAAQRNVVTQLFTLFHINPEQARHDLIQFGSIYFFQHFIYIKKGFGFFFGILFRNESSV